MFLGQEPETKGSTLLVLAMIGVEWTFLCSLLPMMTDLQQGVVGEIKTWTLFSPKHILKILRFSSPYLLLQPTMPHTHLPVKNYLDPRFKFRF